MIRRLRVLVLPVLGALALGLLPALASRGGHRARVQQGLPHLPVLRPGPDRPAGRIYPYYRFDGYTDRPSTRSGRWSSWRTTRSAVTMLPEIGGKIWTAVEKSTGRSFIYDNQVVKFRDIAMRGPWTSGGIEANYGIIGHTPNCATPVDYVTRTNPDGSAAW